MEEYLWSTLTPYFDWAPPSLLAGYTVTFNPTFSAACGKQIKKSEIRVRPPNTLTFQL
jgi:hypothetical protein